MCVYVRTVRTEAQFPLFELTFQNKLGRCFLCVCCVLVRCVWVFVFAGGVCLGVKKKKKKKSAVHRRGRGGSLRW